MDWPSIFEEMSDRLMEDEFNSPIAEAALDIAFDLYPDGSDTNDELMEKRHEFVSDFMEHCRCEYIKECAENLGMVTIDKAQENANAQTKMAVGVYKNRLELQAENFRNMSCYRFSQWKLEQSNNHKMDRVPQDSEDEAWEQLEAFQRNNFDNKKDIPDSLLGDY